MKVRDVLQRLKSEGWVLKRARSGTGHQQYVHPTKPGKVTVSGKDNDDIPRGTLSSIYAQAGWK